MFDYGPLHLALSGSRGPKAAPYWAGEVGSTSSVGAWALKKGKFVDDQIIGLSVRLAEAAARNTAAGVADRLAVLRTRKDARENAAQLEEIVNDLIADKMELLQIARAFEEDLVAQRITPEQAAALVDAVVPALKLMADSGGSQGQKSIEPLLPLLTADMIEALQLLGFNFRKALGEPLTELLADFLHSKGKRTPSQARPQQRK